MKILKKIGLIIVVLSSFVGQAQQLFNLNNQVVFGGDNLDISISTVKLSNGTYLTCGATESSSYSGNLTVSNYGGADIFLVNYNEDFTVNWQKNFGGNSNDATNDLIATSDGGFIVVGSSYSGISGNKTTPNYGGADVWVIKCDVNGNKQWEKIFGGSLLDEPFKIKETNNYYLIAGSSYSGISGNKTSINKGSKDYWVLKIDINGNVVWDKTYGGNLYESLRDITIDNNGNIYLAGNSTSDISGDKSQNNFDTTHTTGDAWLVKINANGDIIWDKTYGNDSENFGALLALLDNYIYLTFYIDGYATPNSGNVTVQTTNNAIESDYLLMKLDTAGNILWDKNYGGDLDEQISNITVVNHSIILTGLSNSNISGNKTENSKGGKDIWCLLLNKNGDVLKDKTIGGASNDYFGFVYSLNYNRFFIGINTNSGVSGDKTIPNYDNFGDIWIVDVSTTIDLNAKETNNTPKILYGPNPTHNHIIFSNLNQNFSYLTVYDIQGKVIVKNISIKNLNTYKLNLNVTKGIYFVNLTATNNATKVVKIIVN